MNEIKDRPVLEQLLEIAVMTKEKRVLPLVVEYQTLIKIGYGHNYIMGKMYTFYSKQEVKK